MRNQYFYLEFTIGSIARFETLSRLLAALKLEKEQDFFPLDGEVAGPSVGSDETPDWSTFLDELAVEWFDNVFDYDSEEGQTYQALWSLTAPQVRLSHPMF